MNAKELKKLRKAAEKEARRDFKRMSPEQLAEAAQKDAAAEEWSNSEEAETIELLAKVTLPKWFTR